MQVACEVGAPGTLKVKRLRPLDLNEAQNLQKRTRHNAGLVTTARLAQRYILAVLLNAHLCVKLD